MIKKILLVIAALIAGVLIFATTKPAEFHIERTATIKAPADKIFPLVSNFQEWPKWSPWEKLDPEMTRTFGGTQGEVGGSYSWKGNAEVGEGRMSVTKLDKPTHLEISLEFLEPFAATHSSSFTLSTVGAETKVTWAMDGKNNYLAKIMTVFMDMDEMVGGMYEKGLGSLKTLAETGTAQK